MSFKRTNEKIITYLLLFSLFMVLPQTAWAEGGVSNSPTVNINPGVITVTEGNSSTTTVTATISVDVCPNTNPITVNWSTLDGSATSADNDFTSASGSIVFSVGTCTLSHGISVQVNGDTTWESDEQFIINTSIATSSFQSYTAGQSSTDINIIDDEPEANLQTLIYTYDSSNHPTNTFDYTETIKFRAVIYNRGPDNTQFNYNITLPPGIDYTSIPSAVYMTGNTYGTTCSIAGNVLNCTNSGSGNTLIATKKVDIYFYGVVTKTTPGILHANSQVFSTEGAHDTLPANNTFDKTLNINVPGGQGNTATVTKTVDNAIPSVGDNITFDINLTNHGFDKRVLVLDYLPTLAQGNIAGTTGGAFQYVSYTIDDPNVTCSYSTTPYLRCISNNNYTDGQSFLLRLTVKVLRRGLLTNGVRSFYVRGGGGWSSTGSDIAQVNATGNNAPYFLSIPDHSRELNSIFYLATSAYAKDYDLPDETLTYSASGLPPGLSISALGDITGTVTTLGTYTATITVNDSFGATGSTILIINVTPPSIRAYDNNYSTLPNTTLNGNFITDSFAGSADRGNNIYLQRHTNPLRGTLSTSSDGTFTYNPNTDYNGTDSFTYTIIDDFGQKDSATVYITIGSISVAGYSTFYLINPPETRNIIGNFITTGNTVECLTEKEGTTGESDSYGGTCTNNTTPNNNNRMAKYIDIDGNVTTEAQKTWNSSSSTFTLPIHYDQLGGNGIVWAGLYWQGGVNNRYTSTPQRRAYRTGAGYSYEDITTSTDVSPGSTDANKVLIKLDGSSNYTFISSDTLYYDSTFGRYGGYYAAFKNITNFMQNANLASGDHNFTVANITTNEGRETNTGNYGGWSLVVIYKEDTQNGTPRNISIYNGFQPLGGDASSSVSTKAITIAGFKLPKQDAINASISVFVGEGEKRYGGTSTVYDSMFIEDANGDEHNVTASNRYNIFDATLVGITRPPNNNNDVINTNGIDIDTYDISSVMEKMRDNDGNVSSLIINVTSIDTLNPPGTGNGSDYVTATMVAFSAELYKPNICYDYTLDIDGYVLSSEHNEIDTSFGDQGVPLTTRISIKSQEGDFALRDVNISYKINNTAQVQYITDSVALARNGIYAYEAAGSTGLNLAYDQNMTGFGLYIGAGATSGGPGGVVDLHETRYIRFNNEMRTADINTSFDLSMQYIVNYGSGDLALTQNFNTTQLCPASGVYLPARGIFNVTSAEARNTDAKPFNLYTQVASRDFKVKVFSYNDNFTTLKDVENTLELEIFNAGHFNRDVNISCFNPDSNITTPVFVEFDHEHVKEIPNIRYDGARRNTGFRIWYLLKPDGSTAENDCTSRTDESCFQDLYDDDYLGSDTYCASECASGGTGCYPCLRKYYGKPICSRDNFAIRPESFITTIIDSNQQASIPTSTQITLADSKQGTGNPQDNNASLIAGYNYRLDINATNYLNDNAVSGYHQYFNELVNANYAKMTWNPDSGFDNSKCNQTDDQNISVLLFDGNSISTVSNTAQLHKVSQMGKYAFELRDENWTAVDWYDPMTTHHSTPDFFTGDDCDLDGTVDGRNSGNKQGCYIDSVHSHPDGSEYERLNIQYYPYEFDTSGLTIGAGPTLDRPFVYVNTLANANYPASGDENMSYNIQGTFTAVDYAGVALSNFVDGCYAEDLNLTLEYTFLTSNDVDPFRYDIENTNPTDSSRIRKIQAPASNTPVVGTLTTALIVQDKDTFEKNANGSSGLDLGFNFNKVLPANPRRIEFKDFNISYVASPTLTVDGDNSHIIQKTIAVDSNISFFYAKLTPRKAFYDDVTGTNVTTPLAVNIYCDLGFALCSAAGINTAQAKTNDFNWWKSLNHDNTFPQRDGNIAFQNPADANLSTGIANVDITANGENTALSLTREDPAALPLTVPVNLETDTTLPNYTDRWLIFNPTGATVLPALYKVRFIDNGSWSGFGQTGNVVGDRISNTKSRRMER